MTKKHEAATKRDRLRENNTNTNVAFILKNEQVYGANSGEAVMRFSLLDQSGQIIGEKEMTANQARIFLKQNDAKIVSAAQYGGMLNNAKRGTENNTNVAFILKNEQVYGADGVNSGEAVMRFSLLDQAGQVIGEKEMTANQARIFLKQNDAKIVSAAQYGGMLNKARMNESKKTINEGVLDDMDDDGFMAKRQLYDLAKYAVELHRQIQDTDDLEPWVSAKITKANDYISTVKHYMEYNAVRGAEGTADQLDMEVAAMDDEPTVEMPAMEAQVFESQAQKIYKKMMSGLKGK
jgi:hypothetical protein